MMTPPRRRPESKTGSFAKSQAIIDLVPLMYAGAVLKLGMANLMPSLRPWWQRYPLWGTIGVWVGFWASFVGVVAALHFPIIISRAITGVGLWLVQKLLHRFNLV